MPAKIAIDAQCAARLIVVVLYCRRHHATGNPLVGIVHRIVRGSRIAAVEMGDVSINVSIPVLREVVAQFQIAAILLKAHARTMVVGTIVLRCYSRRELAAANLVGGFSLNGAVTAGPQVDMGLHAILVHRACDDVEHAAHSIRAVEYGGRTAQYFHTVGHQGLIAVADGVAINALILRMPVDKHQQLACTARDTAQVDATRSSCRYAVTHHRAAGDKESRHLLHHRRQYRRLMLLGQRLSPDDRHCHRQMAHIGGIAGARHQHFLQRQGVVDGLCRHLGWEQKRAHSRSHEHRK